jgi:hypothetical protein
MTYFEKLRPWCIIRSLPNLERCIVARFRRRNDAEAHLRIINRLIPSVTYEIIFDPTPEQKDKAKVGDRSPDFGEPLSPEEKNDSPQFFPDAVRATLD